jgi:hypothetical protein
MSPRSKEQTMKKQPKKLTLGRETLRELTSNETARAEGGATAHTLCTCLITAASCPGNTC